MLKAILYPRVFMISKCKGLELLNCSGALCVGQRDQGIPRKHTDLRDEERIKVREMKQQNEHIYEQDFENVKLK